VEDKRIKSALEIAMEKTAGMPELTQEELIQQKEREYKPRGAALANRYLEGATRERELLTELLKYRGQEGGILRKAFLSTLCQSITLEDIDKSLRAIDGIQTVETNAKLKEVKTEVEKLFSEFRERREQRYATCEDLQREKLRGLGISGSAVRLNLEGSEDWRHELSGIHSEYDININKLKENLSHLVGI